MEGAQEANSERNEAMNNGYFDPLKVLPTETLARLERLRLAVTSNPARRQPRPEAARPRPSRLVQNRSRKSPRPYFYNPADRD
jgi:hypothetical protein